MQIKTAAKITLESLYRVIQQLSVQQYSQPINVLNGSTIGEHTRHIIEFFQCIEKQAQTGIINYDKRERNALIQQDPKQAEFAIEQVIHFVNSTDEKIILTLEACYDASSDDTDLMATNMKREITYALEHAIHHMALIKIGIFQTGIPVMLDNDFGIAVSTIKYKQTCAP
jgi:hypothetical protein